MQNSTNKPTIYILATGGTIAGSSKANFSSSYEAGVLGVDSMVLALPELSQIAQIKTEQIANVGSQDMSFEVWRKLANRINEIFANNQADGIVITHGTDSMEESGYFLNLVVKSDKPVVITGAMRNPSSLSSDGALNLFNAVSVAGDKTSVGKGVLIVMNDEIHAARELSKTNTSSVNAFSSPNTGKIGSVIYGKAKFYMNPLRKHTINSDFDINWMKEFVRVDIIYTFVGVGVEMINLAVKSGAKGLVLAGFGNGNLPKELINELAKASKNGVVIVRSSRVGGGFVTPNSEIDDDDLGFITSDNLNPQKARVLLMVALACGADKERIKELFLTH